MRTNDFILKITGGASIPQALDPTKIQKIEAEVSIYEISHRDNQDNTEDVVFKAKICSPVVISEGEQRIIGKDTTSQSKLTRGAIWGLQESVEKLDIDQTVFYQEVSKLIRRHLAELYQQHQKELSFHNA